MRISNHALSQGFTITELMITLAVVAILAALVVPGYKDSVTKSRRAEAQGALVSLSSAMERHFTTNSTYLGAAGTKATPADTGSPWIFAKESPVDGKGGTKYYDLTIQAATATTFTLRATPKNAQAGDGILEFTNTGSKGWDRDNNGSISASENCWEKNC